VVFCRGNGSGQKLLDRVTDLVVEEKEMIVTGQFEQSCSRNVFGKTASMFHVDERVPGAVDDQGWHVNRGQDIADVDLVDHPHERDRGRRARAKSLEAAPPLLQGRIVFARRRPHRQTAAAAPGSLDISKVRLKSLGGNPGGTGKAAIQHQPPASLGIGRGEQGRQRTAFGYAQLRCTFCSYRVHDGADVVHAQLQ
jgi:hypothetical protein